MADSDFKKMDKNNESLLGERALIICGFKEKEKLLIKKIVKKAFIEAHLIFPTEEDLGNKVGDINRYEDKYGRDDTAKMERAIIAGGITNKEFHRLMERVKKSTLTRPLWATLTETSMEWKLSELLQELSRERAMMG